tara:strand:- start:626 stop:877 length:252 start_codon:yes stop_codon:yes gene_type:complete
MSADARYMKDQIIKHLVNGKIISSLQTWEEGSKEGDPFSEFAGFQVKVPGRKEPLNVWVQRDAEGNGGGWLSIENQEQKSLLT